MRVKIVEKKSQNSGNLTEGIIKNILTNSAEHPHGIKVELQDGSIGRVKEIMTINSDSSTIPTSAPKVEAEHTIVLRSDNIDDTIKKGENAKVEFKSSFRFDIRKFQTSGIRERSKEVEKSISKTIASFMNTDGGLVLIGVSDDGQILGIQDDLDLLNKNNTDTFRLQLKNSLESHLENKIIYEHMFIDFLEIQGKTICAIRITPSPEPIFVDFEGKQECYVRVDNESKPYQFGDFHRYWQRHKQQ